MSISYPLSQSSCSVRSTAPSPIVTQASLSLSSILHLGSLASFHRFPLALANKIFLSDISLNLVFSSLDITLIPYLFFFILTTAFLSSLASSLTLSHSLSFLSCHSFEFSLRNVMHSLRSSHRASFSLALSLRCSSSCMSILVSSLLSSM